MIDPDILRQVASLRVQLDGRAAGFWILDQGRLVQRAFDAASDMDPEVARAFAEATQAVPVDRVELGIVRALVDGTPAVSIASELPEDRGSGLWLRAFGAELSVAVPLSGADGQVIAVLAVSLRRVPEGLDNTAREIRESGADILNTDAGG